MNENEEKRLIDLLLKIGDKLKSIENRMGELEGNNTTNSKYYIGQPTNNKPLFHSLNKQDAESPLTKKNELYDTLARTSELVILHNRLYPLKK